MAEHDDIRGDEEDSDDEIDPERIQQFLERLPRLLKEKFGAEAELRVVSNRTKPKAVLDGFVGRIRWEVRLMPDECGVHQVLVELPRRLHPRVFPKLNKALRAIDCDSGDVHICRECPDGWHRALHMYVPQSHPGTEVANRMAKLIGDYRVSRIGFAWILFRRWLAARILPAGFEIS